MNLKNVKKSDVIKILRKYNLKIIIIIGALGILLVFASNMFGKSNQKNNNINNLEMMTRSENIKHAWANGLCENARKKAKENMKNLIERKKKNEYSM